MGLTGAVRALATGFAAVLAAGAALAGAWTQPAGGGFASVGATWYGLRDGTYEEWGVSSYLEYGALEWLTLGASFESSQPTGPASGQPGDTDGAALVRARLDVGPHGDPFSAQLSVGTGLNDAVGGLAPQGGDDETEIDLRALYGRGFDSAYGQGWLNLEGGIRFRGGIDSDELRFDATLGLRPTERWLGFVQAFVTRGLGNNDPFGADYDVIKLAPSVGYRLTQSMTLVFGTEHEAYGRAISKGDRVRLSLWRTF